MTNNAPPRPPLRARRLVSRRNRQAAKVARTQDAVLDEKHELARREVAVLAYARQRGLRVRYGPGPWEIVG